MMINESRKNVSCAGRLGCIQMEPATYVRENLAAYQKIPYSEVLYTDEVTNAQARNLMIDAGRYFNFRVFLHESNFLEEDSRFTVSQCIKLIRLQMGEYNFLLV